MANLWALPESCRSLPGDNLYGRLQAANGLIQLLRNPVSEAPGTDGRTEWTAWIKKTLYEIVGQEDYLISPEDCSSCLLYTSKLMSADG